MSLFFLTCACTSLKRQLIETAPSHPSPTIKEESIPILFKLSNKVLARLSPVKLSVTGTNFKKSTLNFKVSLSTYLTHKKNCSSQKISLQNLSLKQLY